MKRMKTSFFLIKMVIGTILVILSKHWFLIWMGLEMNTMSIIPIILSIQKRRKVEASMKYFIMQAMAATILLKAALMKMWKKGSWLMKKPLKMFSSKMVTMSLLLKLSISPFHFWYPEVMKGLSLMKGLIITTWQKMAPTMLIFSIMKNLNIFMMTMCTISSMILGAWSGLKQTQTRKILAFSSINHMGWIILMSMYNPKMSLLMFFIYIIMKMAMFSSLIKKKTMNMAKAKKKKMMKPWKASLFSLTILSLGGLPPLTGFTKKILAFNTLMANSMILSKMPLILSSLMSLFFYLRMAFKTKMTKFPQKSMFLIKTRKKSKMKMNSSLFLFSIIGMVILPFLMKIIS